MKNVGFSGSSEQLHSQCFSNILRWCCIEVFWGVPFSTRNHEYLANQISPPLHLVEFDWCCIEVFWGSYPLLSTRNHAYPLHQISPALRLVEFDLHCIHRALFRFYASQCHSRNLDIHCPIRPIFRLWHTQKDHVERRNFFGFSVAYTRSSSRRAI